MILFHGIGFRTSRKEAYCAKSFFFKDEAKISQTDKFLMKENLYFRCNLSQIIGPKMFQSKNSLNFDHMFLK